MRRVPVPLPFSFKHHVSWQTPALDLEFPSREEVFTEDSPAAHGLKARRSSPAKPIFGYGRRSERGMREGRRAFELPSPGQKIEGLMASTYILPNRARITTTTRTVPSTPPGA